MLRTIDRPDIVILAQGRAPGALTLVALQSAEHAEISALPASGLAEIAEQRPVLGEITQIAARQLSVQSDLAVTDWEKPADHSFGPMEYATRLSIPDSNLASASNFRLEELGPSALSARQLTLVKEAARPRPQYTVLTKSSAGSPALSALEPQLHLSPLESLSTPPFTSLPVQPSELVVLTAVRPSIEVPLLSVRVAARMAETNEQISGGDSAKALDRLEIPDEVRREISARLTPGSSLIVADTSEDSAILPEGDDFLVWAKEAPAKVEPPKIKQANREIRQADRERTKVKQAAPSRAAARQAQSGNWSRSTRRYTRERLPDFYSPRFFSRW